MVTTSSSVVINRETVRRRLQLSEFFVIKIIAIAIVLRGNCFAAISKHSGSLDSLSRFPGRERRSLIQVREQNDSSEDGIDEIEILLRPVLAHTCITTDDDSRHLDALVVSLIVSRKIQKLPPSFLSPNQLVSITCNIDNLW